MNVPAAGSYDTPKLIPAIVSGFNLTAGKAYLLIFPIILDLFLWFGPHFRLKDFTAPLLETMYNMPGYGLGNASLQAMMQDVYGLFFERFNLASLLSTAPVGIPSLMAGIQPLKTPLGSPVIHEVGSWGQMISGFLLFVLIGLALGCVYFTAISRAAGGENALTLQTWLHSFGQVLMLLLSLILILILLSIPMFMLTFVLLLIMPGLAQFAVLFGLLAMVWVLVPLVFSPHGIFLRKLNIFQSMYASIRTVRMFFPGVTLFLLIALVFSQGMGAIWRLAPETSWLTLGGIFGNAFILTGLVASSFIYYRAASNWLSQPQR